MLEDDDFDELFDAFKDKKKQQDKGSSSFSSSKSMEDLPIWKEVKNQSDYSTCNVCRQNIDDEDIVEACGNCHRYYHFRHLREWLKIKSNCPSCRQ
jgi:hypothetical protein